MIDFPVCLRRFIRPCPRFACLTWGPASQPCQPWLLQPQQNVPPCTCLSAIGGRGPTCQQRCCKSTPSNPVYCFLESMKGSLQCPAHRPLSLWPPVTLGRLNSIKSRSQSEDPLGQKGVYLMHNIRTKRLEFLHPASSKSPDACREWVYDLSAYLSAD
jgi:hypothetical protein